ncbi:MAG: hypothetical protein LAP13_11075 [Acidobacteriia bacterium]|nr:hypothetical protein [Terriglobia bacterium]
MPQVDFHAALRRQLGFLESSCRSFDEGFQDEAIRIAQCTRVMMHDTRKQTSVLTHLGAKNIKLTSTCKDIASMLRDPKSLAFGGGLQMYNGMGRFAMGPDGTKYFPKLGGGMFRCELPVEDWWAQTVFVLDPETWVSRKEVVLSAADKDGGAHVDASLNPQYERLIESGDLGYFSDQHGTQIPVSGHHYVALRQMGHELLTSPMLLALGKWITST